MRALFLALILGGAPAVADQMTYAISIAGFPAGTLTLAVNTTPTRYKVHMIAESGGIAALFGKTTYEGRAEGRILRGRLFPSRYAGQIASGSTATSVVLSYQNGVPKLEQHIPVLPPDAATLDPAAQRGSVDILSSAYWLARKRPLDQLCDLAYVGFDGLRRTRVDIRPSQPTETGVSCDATYTRVAGFSKRALRRGQVFPMTLTYEKAPDGYVLTMLTARTVFGFAKLTLQK